MHIYISYENEIVCETIKQLLTNLGHNCSIFESAKDLFCLMNIDLQRPDLIIMQKHQNNTGIVKQICQKNLLNIKSPVVLAASIEDIMTPAEASLYGIKAYLREPIALSELILLISQHEPDQNQRI